MKKNVRGITLVALVVTIIVLLILSAVSINLVLGENGIVTRAREAKNNTEYRSAKEEVELVYSSIKLDRNVSENEMSFAEMLESKLKEKDSTAIVTVEDEKLKYHIRDIS